MNCQDILRILDDGCIDRMTDEEQQAVKVHLAFCVDCAQEWQLHSGLSAAAIPPMPGHLMANCRALVAGHLETGRRETGFGHSRRRGSRFILAGTVLAVSAAAAMLGVQLTGHTPPIGSVAATVSAQSVSPVIAASMMTEPAPQIGSILPDHSSAAREALPASPAAARVSVAPVSFAVSLRPLSMGTDFPAAKLSIDSFYGALKEELRKVPGLVLRDVDLPVDFRIAVHGRTPVAAGNPVAWSVQVTVEDGQVVVVNNTPIPSIRYASAMGNYFPGHCVDGNTLPAPGFALRCLDPHAAAAAMVATLRQMVFPADPAVQRKLVAQLQDRSLQESARSQTLSALENLFGSGRGNWDDGTVRAIIDLASTTAVADERLRILSLLRGVNDPALIQPLISAMLVDADLRVRLGAMWFLQAGHGSNPQFRAALETIANSDPQELVSQAARRILHGNEGWGRYVAANLTNLALTDEARLEPLGYIVQSAELTAQLPAILNEEVTTSLAVILRRMRTDPAQVTRVGQVMTLLHRAGHPASVDLMTEALRDGPEALALDVATSLYTGQFRELPQVQKALGEAEAKYSKVRALGNSLRRPAPFLQP